MNLDPGTWELVALADVAVPDLLDDDPRTLPRLRGRATRVTLRPSQRLAFDLRLVRLTE